MNRLLTLKGLFLSPTLFKVLLQNAPKPHPTPRGLPLQHNLNRNVRPLLCRRLQWDWVDRLRMQGGGKGRWETVSHTPQNVRKETQYGNLTNDQLYICCFFFYDFLFLFFFSFCCLHNETPCIGWEIQKKRTSSGKWWSRRRKLKRLPPKLRASKSVYFSTYRSLQVHGPTWPTSPPSHLQLSAAQGPDRNHSHMPVCRHTLPLHSLSPEPLFISDWPIMVTPSNGVTYALSGWSLFTCQSIRASCCGRSDNHEASASEWTHDRQS